MNTTAGPPSGSSKPAGLVALVGRVAAADRRAFAHLYKMLAPTVAADLQAALPEPADAAAVTSATFVEVWWLARFHTSSDTDIPAWIIGIAARRASERTHNGHQRPVETTARCHRDPDAEQHPPSCLIVAAHDRHNELALVDLLDHYVPRAAPATDPPGQPMGHQETASASLLPQPAT